MLFQWTQEYNPCTVCGAHHTGSARIVFFMVSMTTRPGHTHTLGFCSCWISHSNRQTWWQCFDWTKPNTPRQRVSQPVWHRVMYWKPLFIEISPCVSNRSVGRTKLVMALSFVNVLARLHYIWLLLMARDAITQTVGVSELMSYGELMQTQWGRRDLARCLKWELVSCTVLAQIPWVVLCDILFTGISIISVLLSQYDNYHDNSWKTARNSRFLAASHFPFLTQQIRVVIPEYRRSRSQFQLPSCFMFITAIRLWHSLFFLSAWSQLAT